MFRMLAGGAALAAVPHRVLAAAEPQKIVRLIKEAQALPTISQRIDLISQAFMGVRYKSHTLVGNAKKPELFVVREDAFDCVTFCEVVFAAAIGRDLAGFETALRTIRYEGGEIDWRKRNHYFADWIARNIANKTCRAVMVGEPVKLHKVVDSEPAVGLREFTLDAIPKTALLSNGSKLAAGDIVGFVSRRSTLDYFHTGFVAFGPKGELLLRHASSMRGRVIQEKMADFFAANGTQFATVTRPEEPSRPVSASKIPD